MKQRTRRNQADSAPAQDTSESEAFPDAAGFWRRLSGFVVDILLCFGLPSLASSFLLLAIGYSTTSTAIDGIWLVFLAVVIAGYFTFFSMRGASPGMRVANIKVVDVRTGDPPEFMQSLARASLLLLLIGSWFILILLGSGRGTSGGMSNAAAILLNIDYVVFLASFFGHLWIAWDRKRQTLQDKVAGVIVVKRQAVVQPTERPARTIDPLEWRM